MQYSQPQPTPDCAPIVAVYEGVEVPAAPHLGPKMIDAMNRGRFEGQELARARMLFPPGSRILELGAGSGFVGAVTAATCSPRAMLSVEANPDLIPHIRRLYDHNGLSDRIEVRHGVVSTVMDAPDRIDFDVFGNFLGSRLSGGDATRRKRTEEVPVIRYADLLAEFPHDAILMDIEGAELDLVRHMPLDHIEVLISEVHPNVYGRDGVAEFISCLQDAGLPLHPHADRGRVLGFARKT